ncbi:MAG: ATP-binding cassette domain-containing protein [Gammaproteobacteria bacterium]|jgi:tungstate transport system ATP-binding protein|nr:ATP-binding cassette domain-containing protein [Gammaproteobacteria bacterium]MBU0788444.1 ATP-binding cassette domain-containing protein [Gammaproteobacteria bacterium]MBU0816422.1 ATP-binding cassette domain-containing protein [Gammaproteobacteria bacterium]MBU1788059.1 ATP-binding cassette domain-containing protein [Gammaproteobacteria bacterium]
MSGALFTLQAVEVRHGKGAGIAALHKVDLSLGAGEHVAVVGANGSGKSTLLRLLHGLMQPTAGQLAVAPGLSQAMLFQRPHMLRASVLNNVALGLWLRGRRWPQARLEAMQALARVQLDGLAARNAKTLSGGQQQRMALARAWALQPQVLLLDEPTASLDPHAKREVESLMAEFASGGHLPAGAPPVSLIFASHNLGQVKRLATRVLYLERGQLLADLPTQEFFNPDRLREVSPAAHLFVKGELL